jgi:hypothetical protein
MKDVYEEFDSKISAKYKIMKFKSKVCIQYCIVFWFFFIS